MNYYYAVNGQQNGPVPEDQVLSLAAQGLITPDTLVWREGMAKWEPFATVFPASGGAAPAGGYAAAGAVGGVECSVCHNTFPTDQTIKYGSMTVCAGCKPRFLQGLREGSVRSGMDYATGGARVTGKICDNVIMWIVGLGIGLALQSNDPSIIGLRAVLGFVVGIAYQTFFLGWRGQTLGKMAAKTKVVNPDGSKITYGKALGRALAEIVTGCTLGIGYLIAFWDDEKRTLHDRIAGTRVISER